MPAVHIVKDPFVHPKVNEDSLADNFRQLCSYLFSFFDRHERTDLDLKDLLLGQVFADIYYNYYAGKTFTETRKRELRAKLNDVANDFTRLPSGGAFVVYPKHIYAKEAKDVTLVIHQERSVERSVKLVNDYLIKHLGQPIDLDHLEAGLQASDPRTVIFPRASEYQFFRPKMDALTWPWDVTPSHDGKLILNILLFRRSIKDELSHLKETAWSSFLHPSVAIFVLPARDSIPALLRKICSDALVQTVLGLIGIVLAALALG